MNTIPKVIIYNAVSTDGRINNFIPNIGVYYDLISTWKEDATLAGSETILKSNDNVVPEDDSIFEVPVIDPSDTRPVLVVVDSKGKVRTWHMLKSFGYWKDFIALCTENTPKEYLEYLEKRHIKYIIRGKDQVNLKLSLELLYRKYNIRTVRVESGGILNGVLLRAHLVSEVNILVHPIMAGGISAKTLFMDVSEMTQDDAIQLKLVSVEKMIDDIVWLRYKVKR